MQAVDDFSSKLGLPRTLETVESIDANHTQMARYRNRADLGYRTISGVLKRFIQKGLGEGGIMAKQDVDGPCT